MPAQLIDETSCQGGGVYLWKNIEAAKLAHDAEFQERIRSTYRGDPEIRYFETPILVDNSIQQIIDEAA